MDGSNFSFNWEVVGHHTQRTLEKFYPKSPHQRVEGRYFFGFLPIGEHGFGQTGYRPDVPNQP
jgi:hypothetical protein